MKALSIRQPWAWAIVLGGKDIENRTWWTRYRGPLLIHASARAIKRDWIPAADLAGIPVPAKLPTGGIVGRAVLVGCVKHHSSSWFAGPYGFVLRRAEPLEFVPWPGRLGLFDFPDELKSHIKATKPLPEQAARGID